MAALWTDEVDEILGGDLTAALAYATPARGAVVTPVAPIGLRDADAGTVSFTTSLGFGRKLERIRANPSVALAYHAREHGFASAPRYVLVQGQAAIQERPDARLLEEVVAPQAERFMGAPRRGPFWDRWLREYYADRVPVTVAVERVTVWPDLACEGEPAVTGSPAAEGDPEAQRAPQGGTGPRVDSARAAARLRRLAHALLAYLGADGRPVVLPVGIGTAGESGIELDPPRCLPPIAGTRAGLLGHRYNAQLVGLEARQHTGWLTVERPGGPARYAPHTEAGFRAPANKTLLLLGNGLLAKRGLRRARRAAA